MEDTALKAVLSVISGRVNVCDLTRDQRESLKIFFNPKISVFANDDALRMVEQCLFEALMSSANK